MAQDISQQIQARVESFAAELTSLIRRAAMESVQEALSGAMGAPARRGPGRPRGSKSAKAAKAPAATRRKRGAKKAKTAKKAGRRAKGGRRSEEQIAALGKSIVEFVSANPGKRLEQIGEGMKVPTADLKRPIANLLAAKALRTTGRKRGTMYFVTKGSKAA